ncbi:MAG: hypothetical protein WED00_16425 [Aquisalimonadaceae bacterium]
MSNLSELPYRLPESREGKIVVLSEMVGINPIHFTDVSQEDAMTALTELIVFRQLNGHERQRVMKHWQLLPHPLCDALQIASRRAITQERAYEIAAEVSERGYFKGKGEADWIYQLNSDPELTVTIDVSNLTVTARGGWEPDPNGGYIARAYVTGDQYAVHGNVTVRHRPDGTYGIYNETYDYDIHVDFSPLGIARNVGTILGRPPRGWPNTQFNIMFSGNTNLTNPRER